MKAAIYTRISRDHDGDHSGPEMPTVALDEPLTSDWCCCDVMPMRECPIHGEYAAATP